MISDYENLLHLHAIVAIPYLLVLSDTLRKSYLLYRWNPNTSGFLSVPECIQSPSAAELSVYLNKLSIIIAGNDTRSSNNHNDNRCGNNNHNGCRRFTVAIFVTVLLFLCLSL